MSFKLFNEKLQRNFERLSEGASHLFQVSFDNDELWELYLESFPEGTNKLFRERREYDCSCCRQFIRSFGGVVFIKDGVLSTIWDFDSDSKKYQPVIDALDNFVKSKSIENVFVTDESKHGVESNLENGEEKVLTWYHFYLELPKKFVCDIRSTVGTVQNDFRTKQQVFQRSLEEITTDSVSTVLELIDSNTLYKGMEWKEQLKLFLEYKNEYEKLNLDREKELYTWETSAKLTGVLAKIKNHSIGTLLTNISEGMQLDSAVSKYEAIVAPENYKRPKAIYTKRMVEEAQKELTELGYIDSLERRFARLEDISINNILFANRDAKNKMNGNIFDDMKKDVSEDVKKYSKVEEVSVDNFINNVLPNSQSIELMLESKHEKNLVSLITGVNEDAKTMFKWDNDFSWAYSGNIADSSMKEKVKMAGGNVEGDLRFSIQWNDLSRDKNDLDAHCLEPNDYEIYFSNKRRMSPNCGMLDVDIMHPSNEVAVENIVYQSRKDMQNGTYKMFVRNFAYRGGRDGFRAEIEFDGQIHSFNYNTPLRDNEDVHVANVSLRNGQFTIDNKLPSTSQSKEVWNVKTHKFVPVNVLMYSPNYWDEQQGIGHKHLFFMLNDCINTESPSSFYNEFLKEDMMVHKRFLEALASKMSLSDDENQLSGVGFSFTKRNDVLVKVKGKTERVIRVKF